MIAQLSIELAGEDQAMYDTLAPAEQQGFIVAKLAVQLAPTLLASLATGTVMARLSAADQQVLNTLFAAIRGMPNG